MHARALINHHKYEDVVHFDCEEGYTISSQNATQRLANGSWSEAPTCSGMFILEFYLTFWINSDGHDYVDLQLQ